MRGRRSRVASAVAALVQEALFLVGQGVGGHRSGRRAWVSRAASRRRQRAMAPWSPESSTGGTACPLQVAGRVHCGYSSRPAENDSSPADSPQPSTPGTSRADGLDHHRRRQLAAREHEVADAQLLVDQRRDPLVDPFVASADRASRDRTAASSPGGRLVEQAAARGEQDAARRAARGRDGVERGRDRLDAA